MALNKGYLTAKTNKASDKVYTPAYAIKPLLKYLDAYFHPMHHTIQKQNGFMKIELNLSRENILF